jgi:hypothetical protein
LPASLFLPHERGGVTIWAPSLLCSFWP